MSSIYTISSNYNGKHHSVSFYPAGYGASYDGYVTSLEQYKDLLNETYDEPSFKLMHINGSSEMQEIEDDHALFKAARKLGNGAHLFVTLIKEAKEDASNEEEWNNDSGSESDSEEETDEESDEEDYRRYSNNLSATLSRFAGHDGECHHCSRTNGLRYQYSQNSAYRMCGDCHDDLGRQDKRMWTLAGLPWEDDVPRYPLYREEGSPIREEVCHLQYLLTRLGYMTLSATNALSGSFQGNTERAVERFRDEYNIKGGDVSVYNKKMARKLGEIVRDLRASGHKYL